MHTYLAPIFFQLQKKAGLVSSFSVVYNLGVGPLSMVKFPTRIVLPLVGMCPKIITLGLNHRSRRLGRNSTEKVVDPRTHHG